MDACSLLDVSCAQDRIKEANPKVVILSGGPNSVHEEGSPTVPEGFFEYCKENEIPILGVCYGMQLICQKLGGEVRSPPPPKHCLKSSIALHALVPSKWGWDRQLSTQLPDGCCFR